MDVREKLVELLQSAPADIMGNHSVGALADHLIAHGVTVQEWISVNDRLPDPPDRAICLDEDGNMMLGTYTEWGWIFPCYFAEPTHWMPLREKPKGE